MKKYSILLLLIALSGCSMLDGMLSKEFIVEDIPGEAIPADLGNKTLVYGKIFGGSVDLRFTNDYVALKGDIFDTYAARIVKIVSGSAGEHKLFISDGSKQKGTLRVNALYITNAGNKIYGIALSNDVNIDAPFPEVYTSSSMGSSEGKLFLGWSVDEAHKPDPLPESYRGTYKSAPDPYMGTRIFTVSASGIVEGSEGGQHGGYTSTEQKFLRVVISGTDYECYTADAAYKITANGLFRGSSSVPGVYYNPGTDATFGANPDATR